MKQLLIAVLLTIWWGNPALAVIGLEAGPEAKVIEVVDGDTVVLDRAIEEATQVRLTGIQAPKLPLGREGFKPWPLSSEAKKALEDLVLGKSVKVVFSGRRMDRHGRLLAHLYTDDQGASWVQGHMIRLGMARVYTFSDNRQFAREMYVIEEKARAAKHGIWAHPFYALRTPAPEALARQSNTFQIIEGTVLTTANVKGVGFLNFGDNWRTDFTVRLPKKVVRLFKKDGLTHESYQGKRVRVRGWLKNWNGPMIEVSHPEQIEVLEK